MTTSRALAWEEPDESRHDWSHTTLMKTAVSLPDPLFEAAERLAERLGVSRSELYAAALESYLRSHQGEEITAALNRVYAEEDSSLDEGWAALQAGSLPRDAW